MASKECGHTKRRVTNLREVFGGHFREHSIEVGLVFSVDEPVVEDSLGLVAEEAEDMVVFTNHSRICL